MMPPRENSTHPRQAPTMNASPTLKLSVYGTLKRGYWNHDASCEGLLEIREGQVRNRLYDGPGFSVLEVSDEDILACGTANPLADALTQAGLSDWVANPRPAPGRTPKAPPRPPEAPCTGSCSPSTLRIPSAAHRPPGGLPPGRFQPLPARAGAGHSVRRPRVRLGLHRQDDRHQTAPDRLRLLAGVAVHHHFITAERTSPGAPASNPGRVSNCRK